jgi:Spy/CpxP family protein refolding chaperone
MKTTLFRTHVASSRIALFAGGALATVLALGGCGAHGGGEAVANANPAAQAASRGPGGPERFVLRLFHDQDMNEPQEGQLAAIRDSLTDQWNAIHQTIDADVPALSAELTQPAPDASRVHALADQALASYGQMTHSMIDRALALHATLSDEQRAALVARGSGSREDTDRDLQASLSFLQTSAASKVHLGASRETAHAPPVGAGRPDTMVLRLFHDGTMNTQQETRLRAIRTNLEQQRKALDSFIRASMASVIPELGRPTPDAAKVHAIADQALAQYAQMTHSAVDQMLALQSTLSPAQRATLTR